MKRFLIGSLVGGAVVGLIPLLSGGVGITPALIAGGLLASLIWFSGGEPKASSNTDDDIEYRYRAICHPTTSRYTSPRIPTTQERIYERAARGSAAQRLMNRR
ncbi:MAG: hypothetical protein GF403_07940 [Candidatus Coatesbacteria bacterium]|nr:hypothetical protein [Candidatus Coatesbacteria bacterium]